MLFFKTHKKCLKNNVDTTKTFRKQKGFTLPEVILIVSVLAIISGMAFPDIALFFQRQQVEQEKLAMADIQKAMDSYARECRRLPALENNPQRTACTDSPSGAGMNLTWAEALASFSNMSADSIATDLWGTQRKYTHFIELRNYREGPVEFHYATVRSISGNQCDDTGTTATNPSPLCVIGGQPATTAQKTANRNEYIDRADPAINYEADWADINAYGTYAAEGDDLLVKYADNQQKIQAQDETIRRLERIVEALDRYAQGRFNEELLQGTACISELLFYPPSWTNEPAAHNNPNHPDAGCRALGTSIASRYGTRVRFDVSAIRGDATEFVNTTSADLATRTGEMRTLMRILGLPEDHCCNALTGEAFYYYSHPGASVSGACVNAVRPPYYPPKVSIDPIDFNGSCN